MLSYLEAFYVNQRYGIGLILTSWITAYGAMLLLTSFPQKGTDVRFWLKWIGKSLLFMAGYLLFASLWFWLVGDWNTERISMIFLLIMFSWLGCKHSVETCLVRSSVYFASYVLMTPVSEPLGQALEEINESWTWGELMTPLVILIMTAAVVWFLRHFAYDRRSFVHRQVVVLLLIISLLGTVVEFAYLALTPDPSTLTTADKAYNIIVAACMWGINLFAYYFFYIIARATTANAALLSMKHKNELELEKYQVTRLNYDELRMIRHEIKNHDFYMKELLDNGRYDQLKEYLERNQQEHAGWLKTYECGNYVVDVILNHEMAVARSKGIEIKPEILIPKELPWSEDEICSLLSNLLDNAIEAASQSGAEKPEILFRMQPRQEYLFIKVTNPVNSDVSDSRRLTLKTTKEDSELHGFGTRIMKRIVEKNHGSIRFSMEGNTFITDVMLEIRMEEKQ